MQEQHVEVLQGIAYSEPAIDIDEYDDIEDDSTILCGNHVWDPLLVSLLGWWNVQCNK